MYSHTHQSQLDTFFGFQYFAHGNISYDDDDDEDEDDGKLTELLGCCDADGRGVPHDKMNARRPSQQDQYHHQQLHNHHHRHCHHFLLLSYTLFCHLRDLSAMFDAEQVKVLLWCLF